VRSETQKREADRTTREAQIGAGRLERDRVRQEAAQARRQATAERQCARRRRRPRRRMRGAAKNTKRGMKEPDYFTAHDPQAAAKKKAAKAGSESAAKS
jgi:hypothetical protein